MGGDSWTCLTVTKGPGLLDEDVRAALKMAACDLKLNNQDRMRLVTDGLCDGVIETKWDTHMVGTRAGVLFRAQVECEAGEYYVNFLLSVADLERGADVLRESIEQGQNITGIGTSRLPIEALYDFHDLRAPRSVRDRLN